MIRFPVTPAEDLVLSNEDLAAFHQLRAGLHAEHCAATPTELLLVEELVQNAWRIRRFRLLEAANLELPAPEIRSLTLIQRALVSAERACHRGPGRPDETPADAWLRSAKSQRDHPTAARPRGTKPGA